jgi:ribosome maturation factor RimP
MLVRGDILDRDLKKELISLVGDNLKETGMWIDDCFFDKKSKNLEVVLDSNEDMTIDRIVEATKIIDPIVDKANFIEGKYVLDIYGKAKGD